MVTQAELTDLLNQAGSFFTPANRAEMEAELLNVLRTGLPDWDSGSDTILRRALPLIAEQVEVWLTTNEENVKQGLLAYAEGPLLDIFGLGPPLVRRRLGEADDPYRLRIANSSTRLNLGSLDGYEEAARETDTTLVDSLAVVAPNRQNVKLYVVKPDAELPVQSEIDILQRYFNERGNSIAGAEIQVSTPTVRQYRINVTAFYDPSVYSEEIVSSGITSSLYAYIRSNREIGRKIYLSALNDAAFTPECIDVTAQFVTLTGDGTDASPYVRTPVAGNLNIANPSYSQAFVYTCPETLATADDLSGGILLDVRAA